MSEHDQKDFSIFCNALVSLVRISGWCWRNEQNVLGNGVPADATDCRDAIAEKGVRSWKDLEALLEDCKHKLAKKVNRIQSIREPDRRSRTIEALNLQPNPPYILPPMDYDSEYVPVLAVEYWVDAQSLAYQMRLGLGLLRILEDSMNSECFYRGAGFRFETGESVSPHGSFHVQPTPKPFTGDVFTPCLPCCHEWMLQTYPCIQFKAGNPVSLLLFMLLSLYGRDGFKLLRSKLYLEGRHLLPLRDFI